MDTGIWNLAWEEASPSIRNIPGITGWYVRVRDRIMETIRHARNAQIWSDQAQIMILKCSVGDPHLWLMDPDPTSNPTPFFSDFKDAKKNFLIISSCNLNAGTLYEVLKIKFFARILC